MSKEYNIKQTNARPCYKTAETYGICQQTIVPPKPGTYRPSLFMNMTPHPMPNTFVVTNQPSCEMRKHL